MADRSIFVNLPVDDLPATVAFFTALGFGFDERFADETATCMVIGDGAYAMLLTRERFGEFTAKEVCGPDRIEAILAVSVDDREEVDRMADTALASGGSPANPPMEYDFMYGRSFHDPDGHMWEVFWMDPDAMEDEDDEEG
jgi:hypothetical protein